jgi:hypothetical protein
MPITRLLVLLALVAAGTLAAPAHAEGPSTFEHAAFVDVSIDLCSQAQPQHAAQFQLLRQPPLACAAPDTTVEALARNSPEYKAFSQKLRVELTALPKKERLDFCASLLQSKC